MSFRILKINELLKSNLGEIFRRDGNFKDALVTISQVETTNDLREAKIFVSIFPSKMSEKLMENLNRRKGFFQKELHGKLYMKPMPKIFFVSDRSQEKTEEIEEVIRREKKEEGK